MTTRKLPNKKTLAKKHSSSARVMVIGSSKFGKTTFCSHTPNGLFLAFEPGHDHLDVYQVPIQSWEEMYDVYEELAKGEHQFDTIICDTVDNMYQRCSEYICKKFGINHESDLGYGKGYALVNNEFQRMLTRLAFLPQGLYLISHCETKEIETRQGKVNRVVATLPAKARRFVLGLVDIILYCDLEVTKDEEGKSVYKRVLRTKPNLHYDAGDRTGKLPDPLEFDYQVFAKAFEAATATNAQQETIKQEKTHVRK